MEKFYRFLTHIMIFISVSLSLFACYVLVAGKIGESKIENIDIVKKEKLEQLGFREIAKGKFLSSSERKFLMNNDYYFKYSSLLNTCPEEEDFSKNDSWKEELQKDYDKCVSLGITNDTFREKIIQEFMSIDASAKKIDDEAKKNYDSIRTFAFLDGVETNYDLIAMCFLISVIFIVLTASISAIFFFLRKSKETTTP